MPLTTGFNHIAMLTSDMDRTVGFYETAFDAKVVAEIVRTDEHPWMKIVDIGGGAALNVFEVPEGDIIGERRRIGHRGALDHFAFAIDSRSALEEMKERLARAGAQEVGEIQQLGGELSLFFRDADGFELEVCSPAS
jgi:catechol 2,3-dioxygenase-like lactoylglutathione lyase family enzyme